MASVIESDHDTAAEDIYAFQRRVMREQNRADAAAVEAHGVKLAKSALRDLRGPLGGRMAALQILHETADDLAALDRRHDAYAEVTT